MLNGMETAYGKEGEIIKGYVHTYCGDGKGKTTAAISLAVRAAGCGKKVVIARSLKTKDSGEVEVLRSIPGITALSCEKTLGFYLQITEEQKREAVPYYESLLERAWPMAVETRADMMILDETMASCSCHLVEEKRLSDLLDSRSEQLELTMTGRNPLEALQARTDYILEIKKAKHSSDNGVAAREGIEY